MKIAQGLCPCGRLYFTFWSNLSKNLSFGSCTLTIAPMGVKFGTDEWTMPNFTLIGATCRPWGAKNLKIGLWINQIPVPCASPNASGEKLSVFGHPGSGWNPSPTKLGMVIEDLKHVLAPLKLLGMWRIVSSLGGAENFGITRPCQLKTPITP